MNLIHTIYEPARSEPHPAILTLHGRGANAFDLLGLAPYLCGGKFLMICPQGPLEMPISAEAVGYAWYPMSLGGPPDMQAMLSAQRALSDFADVTVLSDPSTSTLLTLVESKRPTASYS